jgi:hypothetical protein
MKREVKVDPKLVSKWKEKGGEGKSKAWWQMEGEGR